MRTAQLDWGMDSTDLRSYALGYSADEFKRLDTLALLNQGARSMSGITTAEQIAHIVDPGETERLDVLGPVIEYLTQPRDGEPCVMRGTIPPGVQVPLHRHADPETFLATSGEIEGLRETAEGFDWASIRPGDIFHVPGGAKHAFRNRTNKPAVMVIVSTDKIGRFFKEVGSPAEPGRQAAPPTAQAIQRFLETSERYGYWNATPEENAAVGISLPLGRQ